MMKSLLPRFPATLQQLAGTDEFLAESHIIIIIIVQMATAGLMN